MELIYNFRVDISINKQYYHLKNMKILTNEAKCLRARIINSTKEQMRKIKEKIEEDQEIEVKINFYEDWYTQKKEIKKKDLDNRLKFFIDSVFKAIEIDDSRIFKIIAEKKQDEKNTKVKIEIKNIEKNGVKIR